MRHLSCLLLAATAAGCAGGGEPTQPDIARALAGSSLRYRLTILEPEAAGLSQGAGLNNAGLVAGYQGVTGGFRHAASWANGVRTDLGTLPGGLHSMLQWPGVNDSGQMAGISRIGVADSLGEFWSCSAFLPGAGTICHAFFWENEVMTQLATLGGTNGFAAGLNNRAQVVGWAETAEFDPSCTGAQQLGFKGVLWEPRAGTHHPLEPLSGHSASAATAINQQGEAVGISGECDQAVGRKSAIDAVLWDKQGNPIRLDNLGGDYWHTPMALNDRGEVVGFGNPPGGNFDGDSLRAFYWSAKTGIRDLGRIEGYLSSQALGINGRGQIVGVSCGAICRGLLWVDGQRYILQDLLETATDDTIWSARGINDAGVITGRIRVANTGRTAPFVATPVVLPNP